MNADIQPDLGIGSGSNFQPQNLSLDATISHILEDNDLNQTLSFNPNLVIEGDNNQNTLNDYGTGLNHNIHILRQFNELHSSTNTGLKKDAVIEFEVKFIFFSIS